MTDTDDNDNQHYSNSKKFIINTNITIKLLYKILNYYIKYSSIPDYQHFVY